MDGVFPVGSALRSLNAHRPDRITISSVNRDLFIAVLRELAPELPEACGEYLFDTLVEGETMCPQTLLSSYFGSSLYRIEHTILFEVGEGCVNEEHQHISVEKPRVGEQEPKVTLARKNGQLELELDLSLCSSKETWNWAERIGDAIGVASLPARFTQAPSEHEYFEDQGVSVSLSEDVVVRTILINTGSEDYRYERASKERQTRKSVWLPCSLYVKDPERDDMCTVLPLLDSERGKEISESGLFELGERFVAKEAPEISAADMRGIAESLPFKVRMEVYRSVLLGYANEFRISNPDGDWLAPCGADPEGDSRFTPWGSESAQSEESSEEFHKWASDDSDCLDDDLLEEMDWPEDDSSEEMDWSPDNEQPPYYSSITVSGLSNSKDRSSIGLTSRLAAEGNCSSSETPSEARRYERDGLFMSVAFEGGEIDVSSSDVMRRFALVRKVADKMQGSVKLPVFGRFVADLEYSRRGALRNGETEQDGFAVDYIKGRLMVHVKRLPSKSALPR